MYQQIDVYKVFFDQVTKEMFEVFTYSSEH